MQSMDCFYLANLIGKSRQFFSLEKKTAIIDEVTDGIYCVNYFISNKFQLTVAYWNFIAQELNSSITEDL